MKKTAKPIISVKPGKKLNSSTAGKAALMEEYVNSFFSAGGMDLDMEQRFMNDILYGVPYTNLEIKYGKENVETLKKTKLWKLLNEK